MKRYSLALFVTLLVASTVQSQSFLQPITYKKVLRPALHLSLTYKPEITEQTILAKLKETGYKPQTKGNIFSKSNKQEGFYVFPGVQLPELNNQRLDLYFKVDPMNGDSSFNSAISLLVSKGYDNFVSPDVDSATFAASERFLNGFITETAAFSLEKQLEDQKKKIAAAEKDWQNTRNKQEETSKKITQLEADRKNLEDAGVSLQKNVDAQRKILQDLEAKRSLQ